MERDVLQVFASTYVAESDILTEDKLMLIDYIREADEFGVMYLLSTGEMLGEDEYLDEEACGILYEQYEADLAPLLEAKPKGYYKRKGQHIKTVAGRKVAAAKGAAVAAGGRVKGAAKNVGAGVKGAAGAAKAKTVAAGAKVKGAASGAAGKVGGAARGAAFDAQVKLRGAKKAAVHRVKGAGASMKQAGAGMKQAGKGIGGAAQSMSKIPGAKPAAIAAAGAAASYAVYKRFFSAASKACKGKSGGDRSACVDRFKKQAKMAQVRELQKASSRCGSDAACRAKLQSKIAKAKSNM